MRSGALCALLCGLAAVEALEGLERTGDGVSLVQGLVALGAEQRRAELELGVEAEAAADAVGEALDGALGEAAASATANKSTAGASTGTSLSAGAASLKERVSLLEAAKQKAVEEEDYDLAKQLKREIGVLLGESSLDHLRILKQAAVDEEDFGLAKALKQRIGVLQNGTSMGIDPELAAKVKAYYSTGGQALPWGWRSARDPGSGLDYYWPVNDRTAVAWERPTAAAPGVPQPQALTTVVRTTTPPPPYEVKSAKTSSGWARCRIDSNGTKPGTYNISVRAGPNNWVVLPDIPGTVIRNATDNATLLSDLQLISLRKEAMARKHWVGERLEVKTKSNAWVPCVVTGLGNETDTYNVHVPFAPVGHQEHSGVSANILRQATTFGQKDEAATSSNDTKKEDSPKPEDSGAKKEDKAEASPSSQQDEERKDRIREVAYRLTRAYWRHKKHLSEEQAGKDDPKDKKGVKDAKDDKDGKADKNGKDGKDSKDGKDDKAKASDSDEELEAYLLKSSGAVRPAAEASALGGGAVAFFMPDDGSWCLQGEPGYLARRLARLRSSPLAEGFRRAEALAGTCGGKGYEEGPLPDVCLEEASLYLAKGHSVQETPFNNFLSTHGSEDVTRGLMELCD